jgi:hypothetical protein
MPTLRTPACLLSTLCLLLTGCPDPSPLLIVRGAETAQEPDGAVRVTGIVSNGGYDDFDGTLCLTARWLRGAEALAGEPWACNRRGIESREPGGEVVDEATVCVKRELEAGEEAFFELRSNRPLAGEDLMIAVSVSHYGDDEARTPCGPTLFGMPPAS